MASQEVPIAVPKMKLKILSNAEEVGNHVFDNVPVDTTVGWIKQFLRKTLPSHPPTEAQRILYQARFLDNDSATLAQIFGEPLPEEQAFHLVLRAPRASRLNPAASEPRTASAPPTSSRMPSQAPGQPDAPQARTQVHSANVGAPHIELNIGDIGDQIQQAFDQVQTQLHQAGFTHIQIPRVGSAVQRATQAEIDGALRDAGLQGDPSADDAAPASSGSARPSVTVSQHSSSNAVPQQQPQVHQAQQPLPLFHPPSIRVTQTVTGTALPPLQNPHVAGHFTPPMVQHMQAHHRAAEMAAQHSQQMQMLLQARNQHVHPAFRQTLHQPNHAGNNSNINNNDAQRQHEHNVSPFPYHFPGQIFGAQGGHVAVGGANPGVVPTNPFMPPHFVPGQAVPDGLLNGSPVHLAGGPSRFGPFQGRFQRPGQPMQGNATPPSEQQRAATPSQVDNVQLVSSGNGASNFADRMQQIQRELEQVSRRTQELSSQRLSALGQMPSSVQQSELRDGFRTMVESLQRMRATLDVLAGDSAVANQPGFVPLRTLVEDWLLQVQAVEIDTSRWLGRQNGDSTTAALTVDRAENAIPGLQPTVAAAFPPTGGSTATAGVSVPSTAGNTDNIMLVRDASGQPQALLIGPSGTYRTSAVPQDIIDRLFSQAQRPAVNRNDSFSRFMRRAVGLPEARRQPDQAPPPELRQALIERLRAVGAQANRANQNPQQAQQPNGQAQNGNVEAPRDNEAAARNFIRVFINPLWLVIRIAGMMYLFGGVGNGLSSWFQWRPLGIALMMLVAYLAQQPWMVRRVEAIRVHFEQLFGVPLNHNGAAGALQPNQALGQAQAGAQQDQGGAPAPDRAAAARAAEAIARVEQPGQAAQGTLRDRLRSVERAVALFAASLVPGMGEGIVQARQIAEMEARTAAEAAAAQQQREREEAAAAIENGGDGQEPVAEDGRVTDNAASPSSTEATAGSSTQVDLADGDATGSGLNRVNKGKEKVEGHS